MSESRASIDSSAPIGVFDSGVGGLTVLKALQAALPCERFIYLGDTARLPYGTKSPRTVQRYAVQASGHLVNRGVKALVVACNTASAVALDAVRDAYAEIPVFGVLNPGAAAACAASTRGRIAVLATESTVRGGAYQHAVLELRQDARVYARACPLLVTLAEDGWVDGPVPEQIVASYLDAFLHGADSIDCLLLGCTHFPILKTVLERRAGKAVALVDSAETTARRVAAEIVPAGDVVLEPHAARWLLATDDRHRFARVGRHFLGESLAVDDIELVDL